MRGVIVVHHLRQRLAWNPQVIREVIVAGGDHDLPRAVGLLTPEAVLHPDAKAAVRPLDAKHRLILPHIQLIVVRHLAVVLQRLIARGLLVGAGERDVADLQQLRRGKEGHVGRVVKDRVAQAALVHQHRPHPAPAALDGARQAGRTSPDHKHIESHRAMATRRRQLLHLDLLRAHSNSLPTSRHPATTVPSLGPEASVPATASNRSHLPSIASESSWSEFSP